MSSDGFDSLADCIQDILEENDPELETITFHQQGCVSEHDDDQCSCKAFTVPVDEVHMMGPVAVAEKLTPWLDP